MQMGLNKKIAIEKIMELEIKNYVNGPIKDKKFPLFNLWIFGIESPIGFFEIYIKLSERKDNQRVVCISFHKANLPFKHPFK